MIETNSPKEGIGAVQNSYHAILYVATVQSWHIATMPSWHILPDVESCGKLHLRETTLIQSKFGNNI